MHLLRSALLSLALVPACAHHAPTLANLESQPGCAPEGWPDDLRAPMRAAQARGLELAHRDRYAWEATDRMAEALAADPALDDRLAGAAYLIDDGLVRFVDEAGRTVGAVRFATPDAPGVFTAEDAPPDPTLLARRTALVSAFEDPRFVAMVERYNPDVLPWSDAPEDGWAVYLVPGAQRLEHVPLGGGWLAHVSPDGATVLSMSAVSKSVLDVPVSELRGNPDSLFAATSLAPLPDPTWIAFSTIWGIPLVVITSEKEAWLIDGARLCYTPI